MTPRLWHFTAANYKPGALFEAIDNEEITDCYWFKYCKIEIVTHYLFQVVISPISPPWRQPTELTYWINFQLTYMFNVPPCYSFLQTPQSQQPVRHQRPHQFQPQLKHQVGGVLRVKLYIILALSRPEYSHLIGWLLLWYLSYHSVHVFPSNTSSSWSCGQYQCKLYVYHMLHLFWYLYWHGTFGCFMWWYIIRKHP